MTRRDIIQDFIDSRGYQSYLEIGVDRGEVIGNIRCGLKVGVDPNPKSVGKTHVMGSDEFFGSNAQTFDIVFIDGLHHSDQVYRDIMNSMRFLNGGGVVVLHDILPVREDQQRREPSPLAWNGDCWKAFLKYKYESPYLCYVIDRDWGCGVIDTMFESYVKPMDLDMGAMDWDFYTKNRHLFGVSLGIKR